MFKEDKMKTQKATSWCKNIKTAENRSVFTWPIHARASFRECDEVTNGLSQ